MASNYQNQYFFGVVFNFTSVIINITFQWYKLTNLVACYLAITPELQEGEFQIEGSPIEVQINAFRSGAPFVHQSQLSQAEPSRFHIDQ